MGSVAAAVLAFGCYSGGERSSGPGDFGFGPPGIPDEGSVDDPQGDGDGQPLPAACDDEVRVGAGPIRRLSHLQYDNAIRDLLGDDTRPARAFVPEEVAYGFSNNAAALVTTELLAEQYLAAAHEVAQRATLAVDGLVSCAPGQQGTETCARAFVERFGRRAFRRPLDATQIERLLDVYRGGVEAQGFALGIQLALETMLLSPWFLYRVETGEPVPGRDDLVALDPWELAARLSFLLWSSVPDDTLLDAAQAGELSTAAQLASQAERMLDDPRAVAVVADFHRQLLGLSALPAVSRDPARFPGLDDAVLDAMLGQADAFVAHVVLEDDARLPTLLGARYTFADETLASFLGLPVPYGAGVHKIDLPASSSHAGLLTLAGSMTTHAGYAEPSVVQRGKLVRERLLCETVPPPPDDLELDPELDRLDDPACRSCHEQLDPIGVGFSAFDAVGREHSDLDGDGEILGGPAEGAFAGPPGLAAHLAEQTQVHRCLVAQWFRYAFGRRHDDVDECTLARLQAAFDADLSVRDLLVEITRTDAFRFAPRTPEGS